jgi:hypothetical protein
VQELQRKILDCLIYRHSTRQAFNEVEILDEMPHALRAEVALLLCRELLEVSAFLRGCSTGFITALVTQLQPQVHVPAWHQIL